MKKVIVTIVIVIILVLGFFVFKNHAAQVAKEKKAQEISNTITSEINSVNNWKTVTFSNESAASISIKYPSTWKVTSYEDRGILLLTSDIPAEKFNPSGFASVGITNDFKPERCVNGVLTSSSTGQIFSDTKCVITKGVLVDMTPENNEFFKIFDLIVQNIKTPDSTTTTTPVVTQNKPKTTIPSVVQTLFKEYKNGMIQECPSRGMMFYSASLNGYDALTVYYNASGKSIGSSGGFSGKGSGNNDPEFNQNDFNNCVTVYVVAKNIWGYPTINKYNLQ